MARRSSKRRGADTGAASTTPTRHGSPPDAPASQASQTPPAPDRAWWISAALIIATLLAYQPAWHGEPVWDDEGHLTKPELQSLDGLHRIWVDVSATQQYYPLVHSAFWVMNRLWGHDTTGYHLVNIGLHSLSACLVWVLLRRLAVPGALLAAWLFALHPVQVESVAWITELKNTLSTPFYLGAALLYLRFDETRRAVLWAGALALFVLALLSKTVTATLPVSLLIVFWWRRGALTWARDVRPIVPFVALAVAAGLTTAWVEHALIGARGADFGLQPIERVLVAGRAVWFYLGTLLWPANLAFTYPQWTIDQTIWWQYLPPLALGALLFWLWTLRRRTRAPLAALLLYGTALGPALGFVDVYPFRYAFVADHFQYLATIPAFAGLSAALTRAAASRLPASAPRLALAVPLVAALAGLTWRDAHQYADAETLYRSTIARNPRAWMAYHNLGVIRLHAADGGPNEALPLVEESLRLQPRNAEALNTRGYILHELGRVDEARRDYEASIRIDPGLAAPYNNLGALEYAEGRIERAAELYRHAVLRNRADPEAQRNLGSALLELGRTSEAEPYLERAYALAPEHPDVLSNLGSLRLRQGRLDEAIDLFERALARRPAFPGALNNFGLALEAQGRLAEAEVRFREVVRLEPESFRAHDNLGYVLLRQRRLAEAVPHFSAVIRLRPDHAPAHASLAMALEGLNRLDESIAAFRRALAFPANAASPDVRNGFGVALARRGRREEAIREFREALRLAPDHRDARTNLARLGGSAPLY